MKKYKDKFGNIATIEKTQILPYKDATEKQDAFILKCFSLYDNDFMYYLNTFETEEDALDKLKEFSAGTFKQENNVITITTFINNTYIATTAKAKSYAKTILEGSGNRKKAIDFLRKSINGITLEELGIETGD